VEYGRCGLRYCQRFAQGDGEPLFSQCKGMQSFFPFSHLSEELVTSIQPVEASRDLRTAMEQVRTPRTVA